MFKKFIIILLFLSQTTWANCPEEVQVISKGQIANCDGILLSPEASKKADEAVDDAKYYKTLSEKLQIRQDYMNRETSILDQRLKLYVDQSQVLATELVRKDSDDKWQKFIWFGLGVLATGIAVNGAAQLNR